VTTEEGDCAEVVEPWQEADNMAATEVVGGGEGGAEEGGGSACSSSNSSGSNTAASSCHGSSSSPCGSVSSSMAGDLYDCTPPGSPGGGLLLTGDGGEVAGGSGAGGTTGGGSYTSAAAGGSSAAGSSSSTPRRRPASPRYKLLHEGDIQLCRLNHTRTIVSKIMNSKYLRRWESHHLVLDQSEIKSSTPAGFMDIAIPYSSIEDVNIISRWDAGQKFCIRITIPDGSVLLQANNSYLRDQWLHSVQWKRHMLKFEKLLMNTRRPEVLVKEIKNMIALSLCTPIQDKSIYQFPLDLVSRLLQENEACISQVEHEQIIVALAPLLENNQPTQEICDFFSRHCKHSPRSHIVIELFTPVVQRILKHNTDFGKFPRMRTFIQEYVQALSSQNDGRRVVQNFVKSMHGQASNCPHPRVLPNLVAVCLSAMYNIYEERKNLTLTIINTNEMYLDDMDDKSLSYVAILETMSEYDDWRPTLSSLLQPIPFPDDALGHSLFTMSLKKTIENITCDHRCDVHQMVLGIREGKEGWFHLYCPGGIACDDEGELYGLMVCRPF